MAQPVWVLSVDLQTKTATFETGLAGAAKTARGAFSDIKSGANEMGTSTGTSMMSARHGVMLLGEEFGVHLPRALTSFIASIGPVGAAMEAAFPFLAIAVGATLLLQHLEKLREAGAQLTEDQLKLGTTIANTFNSLDDKILQAQIRADELNHNHLKALDDQLKLIDRESMNELVHSFEEVAKAGDVVMKELEGHWYSFGQGSEGAKHALDDFQAHYDNLLAQGKTEQASGLLKGTEQQAQHVLEMLQNRVVKPTGNSQADQAAYDRATKAHQELDALGVKTGANLDRQIAAQQNLVEVLQAQLGVESRIADLKGLEGHNAKTADAQADAKYDKEQQKKLEEALAQGRAAYMAGLHRQYEETVATINQGERENVIATKAGSAERLAAIETALKAEEDMGLQGTSFYRELLTERVELEQHLADEAKKQAEQSNAEDIRQEAAMAELKLAAVKTAESLQLSISHNADQQRLVDDEKMANEEYEIKKRALDREIQALDQSDTSYLLKLKQLQNQEEILTQQHENQLAAIRENAETQTNDKLAASYQRFTSTISGELTKSIMGHQTWAKTVESLGDQMISGMIKNAIMYALSNKTRQESDARAAASAGYKLGLEIGGPAGAVLAPIFGAVAFAGAMAFEHGGIVPGYGDTDSVRAVLTPGETVLPKNLSEGLQSAAKGDGLGGGHTYHVHIRPTYHVQTIDGDGMKATLEKHSDQLQRHFENTLRRMNH